MSSEERVASEGGIRACRFVRLGNGRRGSEDMRKSASRGWGGVRVTRAGPLSANRAASKIVRGELAASKIVRGELAASKCNGRNPRDTPPKGRA